MRRGVVAVWLSAAVLLLVAMAWSGQVGITRPSKALVLDWTNKHVVFSAPREVSDLFAAQRDPRYWQQYYRRYWHRPDPHHQGEERDWSFLLGPTGGEARQASPAKYVIDITQPPSCTGDYVATGIYAAGGTSQANIVAVNNLYSNSSGTGYCSGVTAPTVMFAYNVSPSGSTVPAAVQISLDGTQIAFLSTTGSNTSGTTYFHSLKFQTGSGNGTVTAPVSPPSGSDLNFELSSIGDSTNAVFVDYTNDFAYATTNSSGDCDLHKIQHVFNHTSGNPSEVSGWPVHVSTSGVLISTPVYDQTTGLVFVKTAGSQVVAYNASTAGSPVGTWTVVGGTDDFAYPVVVDSLNKKFYAYSPGSSSDNARIYQASTVFSPTPTPTPVSIAIGNGSAGSSTSTTTWAPDFSNAFFSGTWASALLYITGTGSGSGNHTASLYGIPFTSSGALTSTGMHGPLALATTTAGATPVTEFYNATTGVDYLFSGVTGDCTTGNTNGCVRSINITSGFPTNVNAVTPLPVSGGSTAITVDNYSSVSQAASVYFVTLSAGSVSGGVSCVNGTTNNYCLVKATQSALQ